MVLGRSPGEVLCGHCAASAGQIDCLGCHRIVCRPCAADSSRCDQPFGRMLRLGRLRRLRAVDADGRWGLVERVGALRLIDLRVPAWGPALSADARERLPGSPWPHAWLVAGDWQPLWGDLGPFLDLIDLQDHGIDRLLGSVARGDARQPGRQFGVTRSGSLAWFTRFDETLIVIQLAAPHRWAVVDPMPRGVIQRALIHDSGTWLAAATWGLLRVHGLADGALTWSEAVRGEDGDVCFLGAGGNHLVTITRIEHCRLAVWKVGDTGRGARLEFAMDLPPGVDPTISALSPDGDLVAIARGDDVFLLDIARRSWTTLAGHTDGVTFAAFAGNGPMLITADDDNRVLMRPRTSGGYLVPIVPVDIAE